MDNAVTGYTGNFPALAPRTQCELCGEVYSVGDWPWCRSERNPDGHQKGNYGWVFKG